ncbi:SET and MYND domain-containing protein 5 [Aplysia californica]|uniref:SET and MYND domain-containing protein 5 n=1 Tax=Aplysia californica TaxID=6500 RepID=A0ABM0JHT4_APLCA|nr:SET and MYND domain-containing protein 5 [Aplysia californica]
MVALEDIEPEQEINISYLSCCDLDRGRHSRQKALRENYLFQCSCQMCISQADDESCTSDDDEEEDMDDEYVDEN